MRLFYANAGVLLAALAGYETFAYTTLDARVAAIRHDHAEHRLAHHKLAESTGHHAEPDHASGSVAPAVSLTKKIDSLSERVHAFPGELQQFQELNGGYMSRLRDLHLRMDYLSRELETYTSIPSQLDKEIEHALKTRVAAIVSEVEHKGVGYRGLSWAVPGSSEAQARHSFYILDVFKNALIDNDFSTIFALTDLAHKDISQISVRSTIQHLKQICLIDGIGPIATINPHTTIRTWEVRFTDSTPTNYYAEHEYVLTSASGKEKNLRVAIRYSPASEFGITSVETPGVDSFPRYSPPSGEEQKYKNLRGQITFPHVEPNDERPYSSSEPRGIPSSSGRPVK